MGLFEHIRFNNNWIKRLFYVVVLSILAIFFGLWLGYAYGKTETMNFVNSKFQTCTSNIENIDWNQLVDVSVTKVYKGSVTISYKNLSTCFDFNKIKTMIIMCKGDKKDTLMFSLNETVFANKKTSIDISNITCDSVMHVKSVVLNKSINF